MYAASDNQMTNLVDLLGLATTYDVVLKEASQSAAKLTQASIKNNLTGIPYFREYCGLICCKDGDFKATEPHPGKWNGPAKSVGGTWVSSTFSEDRSQILEIGTVGTCNPDTLSYTGKAVTCENKLGAGWKRVAAYHSHPPGDTQFSKDDKGWSRKNNCPLGLGTCDEKGKPVTKEFVPDMNNAPTQSNPFPGNERTL